MISDPRLGDGLFSPAAYAREDEAADDHFYVIPRKVVHIDDGAIVALGRLYAELLPSGGRLLDLMSSWRSHLPEGFNTRAVVGLGLNAEEMADNPQLDGFVVHDLNHTPSLPYDDANFDAVVCAVSVQYLIQPVEVFTDVRRVLKPGGPVIVSFSNRCFPTKAVAVWLDTSDEQHLTLVRTYFTAAGGWTDAQAENRSLGGHGDPLYSVWARASAGTTAARPTIA